MDERTWLGLDAVDLVARLHTILRHWNRQADGTKKCRPDKVVTLGVGTCESGLDKAA